MRLIPSTYWPFSGNEKISWLRSPFCDDKHAYGDHAYVAQYGNEVMDRCVKNANPFVSAMFKVNLSDVSFASAASAAILKAGGEKIVVSGFKDYGRRTAREIPNYGMYLKMAYGSSNFSVDSSGSNPMSLSYGTLTIKFTGGVTDKYIVVQAFKEGDL